MRTNYAGCYADSLPLVETAVDLPFREMREHRNLTQQDLADLAGVPLEIVRDIEVGVEDVSVEDVERTYQALQTRTYLKIVLAG